MSKDKRNTYFADGVQDEILFNLAKVSQLKVISRTSVMIYCPGGNRNLRSIAESLGVANVVEGTVRSTLYDTRQFRAAEQVYDRLVRLAPDQPMLKVQKASFISFMETGDDAALRAAIAALPASLTDDPSVLALRLGLAIAERMDIRHDNWSKK
ncbi:MAG: hypothetical protein JO279_17510 [Verrucomicrobia bacterium]|nr:hypothetical protein [Verrucomicrobiota bacterium]